LPPDRDSAGFRLQTGAADFEARFRDLLALKRESDEDVDRVVADIIAEVRRRGDAALVDYTERFDRCRLAPEELRLEPAALAGAAGRCPPEALAALRLAAERIEDYHRRQRPEDLDYQDPAGLRLGHRWTAIAAAGLYVPGGTAAYPSSVLMNAIPAKVAGVERLVMTVPAPDGDLNPLVLAAAHLAGITEVYQIGGAQAVAALAYGTETIEPGQVGIDMIAGPSEILVVADGANDPRWIAADLLSQAEHDSAAQAILITDDAAFAEAVSQAVRDHLAALPRAAIARQSWRDYGAVVLVESLDEAPALVDRIAPEHLELAVAAPEVLAARIRNAGASFLGRHTPEAIGDYVAGPNHVLPTARSARFSSGLSVMDFMKRTSIIACTPAGLAAVGPAAERLAVAEGLDAHALSVKIRLDDEA
jgi:histidinol dehydrogenase